MNAKHLGELLFYFLLGMEERAIPFRFPSCRLKSMMNGLVKIRSAIRIYCMITLNVLLEQFEHQYLLFVAIDNACA